MTRLFPRVAKTFARTGKIDAVAFYLILDWKSPRARTRHGRRLAERDKGSFSAAVMQIAAGFRAATAPEQRMRLLIETWGFRVPTASAILAILYPDEFTIYDVGV